MKKTISFLSKRWGIIVANLLVLGVSILLNWDDLMTLPSSGWTLLILFPIVITFITNFYIFCIQGYINKYGIEDTIEDHKDEKFYPIAYLLIGSLIVVLIFICLISVKITEPNTLSEHNPDLTKGQENTIRWVATEVIAVTVLWSWYCHFKRVRPLLKGDKTSFE